jgi:hypothetical protein
MRAYGLQWLFEADFEEPVGESAPAVDLEPVVAAV